MSVFNLCIIIANDKYGDNGLPDLKGAENDGRELAKLLGKNFGWHVISYIGEEAPSVLRGLRTLPGQAFPKSGFTKVNVLIFCAAHGQRIGDQHRVHLYGKTSITAGEFAGAVVESVNGWEELKITCTVSFVFDCCRVADGALPTARGGNITTRNIAENVEESKLKPKSLRTVFWYACRDSEPSYEAPLGKDESPCKPGLHVPEDTPWRGLFCLALERILRKIGPGRKRSLSLIMGDVGRTTNDLVEATYGEEHKQNPHSPDHDATVADEIVFARPWTWKLWVSVLTATLVIASVVALASYQYLALDQSRRELVNTFDRMIEAARFESAAHVAEEVENFHLPARIYMNTLRRRDEAEKMRRSAEAAGAPDDAPDLFTAGTEALSEAGDFFADGDFNAALARWRHATDQFRGAVEKSESIAEARNIATHWRDRAMQSRRAAEEEEGSAARDSADLFANALEECQRAETAFAASNYILARERWENSAGIYLQARESALAIQSLRQAESRFASALEAERELLDRLGADKWHEVQALAEFGVDESASIAQRKRGYDRALAALPGAVEQARERKLSTEIAAQAEEAHDAMSQKKWHAAIASAERVLAIDDRHQEARRIRDEAKNQLVPRWKLVAEIDGSEVLADIDIGELSYETPHTVVVHETEERTARLRYESDQGWHYQGEATYAPTVREGLTIARVPMTRLSLPPAQVVNDIRVELRSVEPTRRGFICRLRLTNLREHRVVSIDFGGAVLILESSGTRHRATRGEVGGHSWRTARRAPALTLPNGGSGVAALEFDVAPEQDEMLELQFRISARTGLTTEFEQGMVKFKGIDSGPSR